MVIFNDDDLMVHYILPFSAYLDELKVPFHAVAVRLFDCDLVQLNAR